MRTKKMIGGVEDKIVWAKGDNGIVTPKWKSTLEYRHDIEIICDYKKGDTCPNDPNNKPAPTTRKTTAKKAVETKDEE